MVYLAGLNLLLLLFDFTYLWARPLYVQHLPWVTAIYDQVKGIEPHPVMVEVLADADELRAALTDPADDPADEARALRTLFAGLMDDDPFALARGNDLEKVKFEVLRALGEDPSTAVRAQPTRRALQRFWSGGPETLSRRLEVFENRLRPVFEANYFRQRDPDGDDPVDWFWLIDLPFLLLFAADFSVRWALALKRGSHRRWWHFPVFNFYDALGLLPWLRVFRLFRIVSIYLRLQRSHLTIVGDDPVSRAVRFVAGAVTEEITDRVTVEILEAAQERIREGTYADIVQKSLAPRRDAIRAASLQTFRDLLESPRLNEPMEALLRLHLRQAVASAEALRRIPLPDRLLAPLVEAVGMAVFESLLHTVRDTLESEEGLGALEQVIDTILDAVMTDVVSGDLETLIEQISMEILQRTKETVAVREWAGDTWHDLVASYQAETGGAPAEAQDSLDDRPSGAPPPGTLPPSEPPAEVAGSLPKPRSSVEES